MKKTMAKYKILKFLLQAGQARDASLKLFAYSLVNAKSESNCRTIANRNISELEKDGYIEKVTYRIKRTPNHLSEYEDTYQVTMKAINLIVDTEDKDANYFNKHYDDFIKPFKRRNKAEPYDDRGFPHLNEEVEKELNQTDIYSMFASCDIPVFQHDKPSLIYLSDLLSGSLKPSKKDGYRDSISKEHCEKYLEKGIYYTVKEVFEYINKLSLGKIDTVKGARLRGIFLSNKSCFVVYVSKKYDNKILRVNIKGEQNLKKDLEASIQYFTNVMRRIPAFDKYTTFKGDRKRTSKPFTNGVYALFFSDGDILAYSIATGYSKGKSNKRDIVKLNVKIERTYLKNETENASVYLTAASERFDKMYVIPTTVNGRTALEYLVNNSLEDYRQDALDIMSGDNTFVPSDNQYQVFPYRVIVDGLTVPVTYMPVFEAKELFRIANSDDNPVILTYKDLLNSISRSVRKDALYYDVDNAKMFDRDICYIYDKSGDIKGELILKTRLAQNGLTYNARREHSKLAEKFNMNNTQFYNAIARGELDVELVIEALIPKAEELSSKKKSSTKENSIVCYAGPALKKQINEIVKKEHTDISKFVRKALKEYIKNHYES